ncbi:hypothetical protein BJX64DRAFT_289134 [Aspergillus heterothallicus]
MASDHDDNESQTRSSSTPISPTASSLGAQTPTSTRSRRPSLLSPRFETGPRVPGLKKKVSFSMEDDAPGRPRRPSFSASNASPRESSLARSIVFGRIPGKKATEEEKEEEQEERNSHFNIRRPEFVKEPPATTSKPESANQRRGPSSPALLLDKATSVGSGLLSRASSVASKAGIAIVGSGEPMPGPLKSRTPKLSSEGSSMPRVNVEEKSRERAPSEPPGPFKERPAPPAPTATSKNDKSASSSSRAGKSDDEKDSPSKSNQDSTSVSTEQPRSTVESVSSWLNSPSDESLSPYVSKNNSRASSTERTKTGADLESDDDDEESIRGRSRPTSALANSNDQEVRHLSPRRTASESAPKSPPADNTNSSLFGPFRQRAQTVPPEGKKSKPEPTKSEVKANKTDGCSAGIGSLLASWAGWGAKEEARPEPAGAGAFSAFLKDDSDTTSKPPVTRAFTFQPPAGKKPDAPPPPEDWFGDSDSDDEKNAASPTEIKNGVDSVKSGATPDDEGHTTARLMSAIPQHDGSSAVGSPPGSASLGQGSESEEKKRQLPESEKETDLQASQVLDQMLDTQLEDLQRLVSNKDFLESSSNESSSSSPDIASRDGKKRTDPANEDDDGEVTPRWLGSPSSAAGRNLSRGRPSPFSLNNGSTLSLASDLSLGENVGVFGNRGLSPVSDHAVSDNKKGEQDSGQKTDSAPSAGKGDDTDPDLTPIARPRGKAKTGSRAPTRESSPEDILWSFKSLPDTVATQDPEPGMSTRYSTNLTSTDNSQTEGSEIASVQSGLVHASSSYPNKETTSGPALTGPLDEETLIFGIPKEMHQHIIDESSLDRYDLTSVDLGFWLLTLRKRQRGEDPNTLRATYRGIPRQDRYKIRSRGDLDRYDLKDDEREDWTTLFEDVKWPESEETELSDAIRRNRGRSGEARIPEAGNLDPTDDDTPAITRVDERGFMKLLHGIPVRECYRIQRISDLDDFSLTSKERQFWEGRIAAHDELISGTAGVTQEPNELELYGVPHTLCSEIRNAEDLSRLDLGQDDLDYWLLRIRRMDEDALERAGRLPDSVSQLPRRTSSPTDFLPSIPERPVASPHQLEIPEPEAKEEARTVFLNIPMDNTATKPKIERTAMPKSEPEPALKLEPTPEPKPQRYPEPGRELELQPESKADPIPKQETKPEPEIELTPNAYPEEPGPEPEPVSKPDLPPETVPNKIPGPTPVAKPEPEPKPEPKPSTSIEGSASEAAPTPEAPTPEVSGPDSTLQSGLGTSAPGISQPPGLFTDDSPTASSPRDPDAAGAFPLGDETSPRDSQSDNGAESLSSASPPDEVGSLSGSPPNRSAAPEPRAPSTTVAAASSPAPSPDPGLSSHATSSTNAANSSSTASLAEASSSNKPSSSTNSAPPSDPGPARNEDALRNDRAQPKASNPAHRDQCPGECEEIKSHTTGVADTIQKFGDTLGVGQLNTGTATSCNDCFTRSTFCSECRKLAVFISGSLDRRTIHRPQGTYPVIIDTVLRGSSSHMCKFIFEQVLRLQAMFPSGVLVNAVQRRMHSTGRYVNWYDIANAEPGWLDAFDTMKEGYTAPVAQRLGEAIRMYGSRLGQESAREVSFLIDFPEEVAPGSAVEQLLLSAWTGSKLPPKITHPTGNRNRNRFRLVWWAITHPSREFEDFMADEIDRHVKETWPAELNYHRHCRNCYPRDHHGGDRELEENCSRCNPNFARAARSGGSRARRRRGRYSTRTERGGPEIVKPKAAKGEPRFSMSTAL